MLVSAGGSASGTTLSSSGNLFVLGTAGGTVVNAGATETISAGGVDSGTTLSGGTEIVSSGGVISGTVTFAGSGMLILNQASNFGAGALLAGFTNVNEGLDLKNILFALNPTIGYTSANAGNTSGTLTVSAGGVVDTLTLIGTYTAASFVSGADGTGGTTIVDPPVATSGALAAPQHA
jgi:autotransporter passenger strand-loop-strand repeat protein